VKSYFNKIQTLFEAQKLSNDRRSSSQKPPASPYEIQFCLIWQWSAVLKERLVVTSRFFTIQSRTFEKLLFMEVIIRDQNTEFKI